MTTVQQQHQGERRKIFVASTDDAAATRLAALSATTSSSANGSCHRRRRSAAVYVATSALVLAAVALAPLAVVAFQGAHRLQQQHQPARSSYPPPHQHPPRRSKNGKSKSSVRSPFELRASTLPRSSRSPSSSSSSSNNNGGGSVGWSHDEASDAAARAFSGAAVELREANDDDDDAEWLRLQADISAAELELKYGSSAVAARETSSTAAATTSTSTSARPSGDSRVPSFRTLGGFLSTTCLIWLSEPLLSLVDTTFVSFQKSGAVAQLAAMGPATTFMDTVLYMTYFLAIATTNKLAEHLAAKDYRELQQWTSRLLGVAFACGGLVALATFAAGPSLLSKMAGASAATSPGIVPLATGYAQIRAAVAPLSVAGMVAQSLCLVTGQTKAVMASVGLASVLNIAGDALLTPIWGMHGASAATAVASSGAAILLLRQVYKQMKSWRKLEVEQQQAADKVVSIMSTPVSDQGRDIRKWLETSNGTGAADTSTVTTSVSLQRPDESDQPQQHQLSPVPLVSFPDRKSLFGLVKLSLPLAFNMWAKMASYGALTVRATAFGAVPLAANSILVRVFYFLCCLADGLGQATQAYLPATLYPKFHKKSFRKVMLRLGAVAALAAVGGGQLAKSMLSPGGASFLARDAGIVAQLTAAAPYLAGCLALHPFITVMEGTVIAKREFGNLVKTYTITLALFAGVLSSCTNIAGVWQSLLFWQVSRLVNYVLWRKREPKQQQQQLEKDEEGLTPLRPSSLETCIA